MKEFRTDGWMIEIVIFIINPGNMNIDHIGNAKVYKKLKGVSIKIK